MQEHKYLSKCYKKKVSTFILKWRNKITLHVLPTVWCNSPYSQFTGWTKYFSTGTKQLVVLCGMLVHLQRLHLTIIFGHCNSSHPCSFLYLVITVSGHWVKAAFLKLFSSGDHFHQSECSKDHPTLVIIKLIRPALNSVRNMFFQQKIPLLLLRVE